MKTAQQTGDTIVEVLIALAVIGLTLAASFGLANNSVRTGRAAQERTEALKIAESQLERTKVYLQANDTVSTGISPFCIDSSGAPIDASDAVCVDMDSTGNDGLYTIRAEEVSPGGYRFDVTWEHATGGQAELDLYYRAGSL